MAKVVVDSFSLVKGAHAHLNQKMSKTQRTQVSYSTHYYSDPSSDLDLDFVAVDYKYSCLPQPMSF